jgi:hypothetical protein
MDESGTLPSDPPPESAPPDPETAPEPSASTPAEEPTRPSASPAPAQAGQPGEDAPPVDGPAAAPTASEAQPATAQTPDAAAARAAAVQRARATTERKRRAWESHRQQSIRAREAIELKLRDAGGLAQGRQGAGDLRKAEGLLNEVRTLLGSDRPGSPGQLLIGPDRRACWDHWRRVRDALKFVRDLHQEQDYQALAAPVAEVTESARSGDPSEALRRVKDLQGRLGRAALRRGQFEELRLRLSQAWQAAQARITAQRQERSRQRDEWRARLEGHLARWRGTLEQKRGQREHLLLQVARLEDMEKNARSEDYAVQVRGWLQETAEKLRRTEVSLAELGERIGTTAKRLGGRSARVRAGEGGATEPPGTPAEPAAEVPPAPPLDGPPNPSGAGS